MHSIAQVGSSSSPQGGATTSSSSASRYNEITSARSSCHTSIRDRKAAAMMWREVKSGCRRRPLVFRVYGSISANSAVHGISPLLTPSPSVQLLIDDLTRKAHLRLQKHPACKNEANIEVHYHPMISKIVTRGRDRTEGHRRDCFITKPHAELFPDLTKTPAEIFALAAVYVALRDRPSIGAQNSLWISLGARRCFHVVVYPQWREAAHDDCFASSSSNAASQFICVYFYRGAPTYVLSWSSYVVTGERQSRIECCEGGLKAHMPSLGVEVKVDIGDRVEIGLAIIMLESMKTETVLRADGAGSIKGIESVNQCSHSGNVWGNRRESRGEMVGEGKELDEIEFDNVAVLPTISE
ncbi:hypothetical protein JB92DRAFT_2838285 [Gautieria morchelliformis]|nr:hypothetical protein JB92DRAFT_2838285 [Gautieria morchelliformis]